MTHCQLCYKCGLFPLSSHHLLGSVRIVHGAERLANLGVCIELWALVHGCRRGKLPGLHKLIYCCTASAHQSPRFIERWSFRLAYSMSFGAGCPRGLACNLRRGNAVINGSAVASVFVVVLSLDTQVVSHRHLRSSGAVTPRWITESVEESAPNKLIDAADRSHVTW